MGIESALFDFQVKKFALPGLRDEMQQKHIQFFFQPVCTSSTHNHQLAQHRHCDCWLCLHAVDDLFWNGENMRHLLPVLFLAVLLSGCYGNNEVEQRRRHTLERMDYIAGAAEDRRVQYLIIDGLKSANVRSLQTASLVVATMRNSETGIFTVSWIAAKPLASGIRIQFSDDTHIDFLLDPIEVAVNKENAESMVLFQGSWFLNKDYPDAWAKLLIDPEARVILIADDQTISNSMLPHRLHFEEH